MIFVSSISRESPEGKEILSHWHTPTSWLREPGTCKGCDERRKRGDSNEQNEISQTTE